MRRLISGLLAVAIWAACSNGTGPATSLTSQLHFVVQDSTAPPLYQDTVSFYAKVSDGRQASLFYKDTTSGGPGEEFLRLEVPGDALLRKPDGSPFQAGDSILISIHVVDPKQFVIDFQPTGLQFDPSHPAVLKIEYAHSDHDYDGDGQITSADSTIEARLDLWRNEPPSDVWFKMGAVNFESYEEIDGNIFSFSQYAVAW